MAQNINDNEKLWFDVEKKTITTYWCGEDIRLGVVV